MITTLIVLSIIAAYTIVGGICGALFYRWRVDKSCKKCERERSQKPSERRYSSDYCTEFHEGPAAVIGVFWPLALPLLVGVGIGHYWADGGKRAEAKAAKERKEYEQARKIIKDAGLEWPEMPGDS